jgi:uncharacterized protein (DUF3084 family)
VNREFVIKGIEAGMLEYRDGVMWGNPYLRILRSQLEKYIIEELGEIYLERVKAEAELRKTKKEITGLKKKMNALQERKAHLEQSLNK